MEFEKSIKLADIAIVLATFPWSHICGAGTEMGGRKRRHSAALLLR